MSNMNEGFDVVDQFEVQDLTDVKKEQQLFPATKDLKVRIEQAALQTNKDKDIYALKLTLRVVDGIPGEDGQMGRVNAPIFTSMMDLVYGANVDVKDRASNNWWKNKQHLVEFKNFANALGLSLSGIKINDEFLSNLIGQELLVTVKHEAETISDPSGSLGKNGKVKKIATGDFSQKLTNWKKA